MRLIARADVPWELRSTGPLAPLFGPRSAGQEAPLYRVPPVAMPTLKESPIGSAMKWQRIRSRRTTTTVSPWMSIIAREVEFSPGDEPQIYHAVE